MKKIKQAILFLVLIQTHSFAQVNLVPNPSFENITSCPYGSGGISLAPPWFQPATFQGNTTNSSSSDLYDTCVNQFSMGVPLNIFGYQQPRTGHSYAGVFMHSDTFNYREYIEVPLLDTLIANRKYCVQFYVSLADSSEQAISNVGAYFSNDSILDPVFFCQTLNYVPQIENPVSNVISDTANWVLISGNFIANGGERFMTIGNFHLPVNTNVVNVTGGSVNMYPNAAYYYIDDVSVVDCTGVGVDELPEATINIIPNPATNQFTIENSQLRMNSIHIYNVLGEEVLRLERIANSQKEIDVSTWKAGVYFLEVETEKGVVRKRLVKEK